MRLRHFELEILADSGSASADETREALGAFLLSQAGYPTESTTITLREDEEFMFVFKERVWKVTFVMILDKRTGHVVPFRIDFSYLNRSHAA